MGNKIGQQKVSQQIKEDQEQQNQKTFKRLFDQNEFHPETALQEMKEATTIQYDFSLFVGEMRTPLDSTYEFYNAPLGSGSLGQVRKALHVPTRTIRAIQLISLSLINSSIQRNIDCDFHIREAAILKQVDHPNIIRMYEYYQDTRFFYIITELCKGGDLYDKIIQKKSFGQDYAAYVFAQILKGIIFCHNKNIVHRDLQPENIMFQERQDDSVIQIVDFGFANIIPNRQMKMSRKIGSILYMAPEVLNGQGYTEKSDIWSIGMILYSMLCGYAAFLGEEEQVQDRILHEEVEFRTEDWNFVSNEAKDLIVAMLNQDPNQRPTAKQALNSKWMKINLKEEQLDPKIVDRFIRTAIVFRPLCEIQTIICWNIMLMMVSYETVKLTYKVFDHLDQSKKSGLEYKDIFSFVKRALEGGKGSDTRAHISTRRLFEVLGKNIEQEISFYQFMLLTMDKQVLLSDRNIEQFLQFVDSGKSNSLTFEQMNYLFMGRKMSDQVQFEIMKEAEELVSRESEYLIWRKYVSYKLYNYVTTQQGLVILQEDYQSSDQEDGGDGQNDEDDDLDESKSDFSDLINGESGSLLRGGNRHNSISSSDGISVSKQSDLMSQSNETNQDVGQRKIKGNKDKMKQKLKQKLPEKVKRKRREIKKQILEQVQVVWQNDLDQNRVNLIKKLRTEMLNTKDTKQSAEVITAQKKLTANLSIRSEILPLLEEILFRQIFDQAQVDEKELEEENRLISNSRQKGEQMDSSSHLNLEIGGDGAGDGNTNSNIDGEGEDLEDIEDPNQANQIQNKVDKINKVTDGDAQEQKKILNIQSHRDRDLEDPTKQQSLIQRKGTSEKLGADENQKKK